MCDDYDTDYDSNDEEFDQKHLINDIERINLALGAESDNEEDYEDEDEEGREKNVQFSCYGAHVCTLKFYLFLSNIYIIEFLSIGHIKGLFLSTFFCINKSITPQSQKFVIIKLTSNFLSSNF